MKIDTNTINEAVKQLAALPPLAYEQIRKEEAKKLKIERVSVLDNEVEKLRKPNQGVNKKQTEDDADVEPWNEQVEGGELFSELVNIFNRYLMLQDKQAEALSLWTIFSYCIDANDIAPKLLIYSPEKRCGKTTLLDVLLSLIWKPIPASNISPAVIYRVIDSIGGTIAIDEADTFIKHNPELNGVINSGHRKTMAYVLRCDGDNNEPKKFSTWSPMVIAMIGKPADTIIDRSILIEMKRKKGGDKVERFNSRKAEPELKVLASKIKRWAGDNFIELVGAEPETPTELNDRASDNWRPLLAIAERIGQEEYQLAKQVALALSSFEEDEDNASRGTLLLRDVREIFESVSSDKISTFALLCELNKMDESPWPEWNRGNEITARQVAKILKPYGIAPVKYRDGMNSVRGYKKADFTEAFDRYLHGTTEQTNNINNLGGSLSGTQAEHVPDDDIDNLFENIDCSTVPDNDDDIPF